MEPRIQYAKTKDGVNIAFWTIGEGEPLVMIPTVPFSHVQLEWKMPAYARWYEHHARERQLLRYDPRGSGLSQRDVRDFSLEAQLQDLTAVVDRAGFPRFALWAFSANGGARGVTYTARFPERVTSPSPVLSGSVWSPHASAGHIARRELGVVSEYRVAHGHGVAAGRHGERDSRDHG